MDNNKKKQANAFEGFAYNHLITELKWAVTHYVTEEDQRTKGENHQGIEIKNDQAYNKTGNLYISVKRVYNGFEYGSGIYRDTETKQLFYLIGDHKNFWLIATKHLQAYYEQNNLKLIPGFRTHTGGQEYGFLLPIEKADKLCAYSYTNQQTLDL